MISEPNQEARTGFKSSVLRLNFSGKKCKIVKMKYVYTFICRLHFIVL